MARIVSRSLARCVGALLLTTILAASASAATYTVGFRISPSQEVPPTGSPAQGFGTVTVNTTANTLSFNITFSGLSGPEIAAHIHGPAAPGVNAGVKFTLPAGSPKIGVWNYPESDEPSILAGLMYVNIHSTSFPGGEMRGQIPRGDCSGPVTRTQAAELVKGSVILTRSDYSVVQAFGPLSLVLAGTTIYDGMASRPLVTVSANSWYFWIDDEPDLLFEHSVRHVLVNASTGCITNVINGKLWPRIELTNLYRGYQDRLGNPDQIWPALQPPGPQLETGALPKFPESFLGAKGKEKGERVAAAPTTWALIISAEDTSGAGSDPRFAKDLARVRRALSDKNANGPMVPDANIQFAAGMTLETFCALIRNAPHNCDKMYIYWIGHGLETPPGGLFFKDNPDGSTSTIDPEKWIQKVDSLNAGEYCIFLNSCFSGRFIKAFVDSGLSGSLSTAADSTHKALMYADGIGKGEGGVYGHALAWCMEQGKTGAQLDQCIRDSIAKYVANRNSKLGSPKPYPNPQFVETKTLTGPGGMVFNSADSCKTVCIQFKGDAAHHVCANSTLYCLTNIHPIYLIPTWVCVRAWNWNVGETRYFDTSQDPNSLKLYFLDVHSNGYPVQVVVTWLRNPVPSTPSNATIFPAWSLGLQNGTVEFGPSPPTAQVNLNDNLYLLDVPSTLGNAGTQFLTIHELLQGDPSRPYMHIGGNPTMPFNGPSTLVIGATGLQGSGGEPVPALPVQLDLFIDGLSMGTFPGQFQPNPGTASTMTPQGPFGSATATIPMPPLRPGQVDFRLSIPGFSGTATLDYLRLDFVGPPTSAVPGEQLTHTVRLEAYPNPGPGRSTIRFELARAGRARVRVFDVNGRLVRTVMDAVLEGGLHARAWNGETDNGGRVRAGLYYIQLEANGEKHTRRLAMLR